MPLGRIPTARLRGAPGASVEVGRSLWKEWQSDRLSGLAGEVAFFNVLSLFPALLAVAAALGSLEWLVGRDLADRAEQRVIETLEDFLTGEASGTLEAVQRLFDETSAGVVTVGVVLTLWTASRGFTAVINAMDVVYDLSERRSYLGIKALALALAAGTVVVVTVVLAMLVLGPLLGTGADVAGEIGAGGLFATLWDWGRWPVAIVIVIAWAATVFHVAPNHKTPWRWDIPGAVVTAVLWALLSLGFRAYLAYAPGANQILGTLGGVLIMLLWQYLLALGLLVGGELNAILAARHGVTQLPRRAEPVTPFLRRTFAAALDRLRARAQRT